MERYKICVCANVLIVEHGKVLMMRRFNTGYEDGKYDFPAGHLEKGEDLRQCAVREVKEETNLQIFGRDLKCICYNDDILESEHLNIYFVTKKYLGTPIVMECFQCNDIKWFDLHDLKLDNEILSKNVLNFLKTMKSDF